jgi:hypothetical protein
LRVRKRKSYSYKLKRLHGTDKLQKAYYFIIKMIDIIADQPTIGSQSLFVRVPLHSMYGIPWGDKYCTAGEASLRSQLPSA